MISAVDKLMASGAVAADPLLSQRALLASMTHVNAYAIPNNIKEEDAFAAVKIERDRILDTLKPARVVEEARTCVEQAQAML